MAACTKTRMVRIGTSAVCARRISARKGRRETLRRASRYEEWDEIEDGALVKDRSA